MGHPVSVNMNMVVQLYLIMVVIGQVFLIWINRIMLQVGTADEFLYNEFYNMPAAVKYSEINNREQK